MAKAAKPKGGNEIKSESGGESENGSEIGRASILR